MPTTYLPLNAVKKTLRAVRDEAREQGRREGREEATRFVQWAAELNGSTKHVLKALGGDSPDGSVAVHRLSGPDVDRGEVGGPDGRTGEQEGPEESVMLALLDASIEAKHHGSDGGPVVEYLQGLLDDPEALSATLAELDGGDVVEKASRFDESKHPRGDDGRFIGREQIHAAKSDPELAQKLRDKTTDPDERKKLDAAIGGETDLGRTQAGLHREKVATTRAERKKNLDRAREMANDISMARRGGEPVSPEHFRELAALVPGMTIADLRSTREKLAASFGGQSPRREEMVRRIVEHAKNKAALLETNEKYEDMDALDFGSLHEYQNEGNAKGNERENPNPEEQHGGAMFQRHILAREHGITDTFAYNQRGADVKPYWKDDQGKNVDTITPTLNKDDGDGLPQERTPDKPSGPGGEWLATAKPDPTILRESHLPGRAGAMYTGGVGGLDKFAEQVGLPSDFYEDHRVTHPTKNGAEISGIVAISPKYDPDGKVEAAIDKRDDARRRGLYEGQRRKFYDQQVVDAWHSVTSEIGAKDAAESPAKQEDAAPALTHSDAKETAQAAPEVTPEQAEARKWKKNDDGTYTAPNGVVWKKAGVGGEVSPVTGQRFEGGRLMPIHGKSQGGLEADGKGGEGSSKVGIGGKVDKKKEKPPAKPSRQKKSWDIHGNLVTVPEGHRTLESIVAGSPVKSHLLSDEALHNTLGLTRKQANDLADIYRSGAVSIPKEALPPSFQTRGHVPSDDWDIAAKVKELSAPPGNAASDSPVSQVPTEKGAKQPHEMTRDEYESKETAIPKTYGVWNDEVGDDRYSKRLSQTDKIFEKVVKQKMAEVTPGAKWPFPPVDVKRESGPYDLKDGHHRIEVAKRLGMKVIPAVLTDPKAFGHSRPVNAYVEIDGNGEPRIIQPNNEALPPIEVKIPEAKPSKKKVDHTKAHRAAVSAALAAGKNVPAQVLADYPDLKAPAPSQGSIPTDHSKALSASRTHHNRRTDTKGRPIGRHVVYRHNASGKVNAVPADSYMGRQLLEGKQGEYTVEGEYEFGEGGRPIRKAVQGSGTVCRPGSGNGP